jgi:hypothetical protein
MGFLGILDHLLKDRRTPVRGPVRSKQEFVGYVQRVVGDKPLAELLGDVVERTGRDGYIYVRQGGNGNPYQVEYKTDASIAHLPTRDINLRIEELKKALRQAGSEEEKDQLRQKIAEFAGGVAVVWIHVASQAEFEQKRQLLIHGYRSALEAAGQR